VPVDRSVDDDGVEWLPVCPPERWDDAEDEASGPASALGDAPPEDELQAVASVATRRVIQGFEDAKRARRRDDARAVACGCDDAMESSPDAREGRDGRNLRTNVSPFSSAPTTSGQQRTGWPQLEASLLAVATGQANPGS
jgi:hypothetical protein